MMDILLKFMSITRTIRQILWLTVLVFFVYKNIASWHSVWFGGIVFFAYLFFISLRARNLLVEWFTFSRTAWRVRLLSIFLVFVFLTWFAGFTIIFGWIDSFSITAGFWLNGLLFVLLESIFIKKSGIDLTFDTEGVLEVWEEAPSAKIGIILYLFLLATAFYYLQISHTDTLVLSPWQVINKNYLIYFFLATLVLGYLLFTNIKVKFLLFFLCAHSLLLHAYLPATHTLFYGGDQWRHLATQNVLVTEDRLAPTLLDSDEAANKFDLGRISYMQYYSASIISARLMQVDLFQFNKWFIPIIWSIFLPLLLYEWGRTLGGDKKTALTIIWLGFLPYIWQASGSFSLPVNFGFLIWLFAALIWFRRREEKKLIPTLAVLIFGVLLFLGYIMYFLVFWLILVVYFFVTQTNEWKKYLRIPINLILILSLGLVVPVAEIFFGYSDLPKTFQWFNNIKQLLGNFSGFYLASGPQSHDIINGNIIFNQLPIYAFTNNFIIYNRWWLVFTALAIFFTVIWVAVRAEINRDNREAIIAGRLLAILLIGYFLGRYILTGEGVLSRRLDVLLAWGIISLLYVGLIELKKTKWYHKTTFRGILILIFATAISASYSLGPDTRTLSMDEYKAMKYVWSEESHANTFCVLADTYPLLGLEAISARKIIGGNFPFDKYYGQSARVNMLNQANRGNDWLEISKQLTSADHCWLVTKMENIKTEPQMHFGHIGVYKF